MPKPIKARLDLASERPAFAPKVKDLSLLISKEDQDVHYTRTVEMNGHKVRLRIRSNVHSFQSWALAEVWSTLACKWNEVATIHHGLMQTPTKLAYASNGQSVLNFNADADKLLALAAEIIG